MSSLIGGITLVNYLHPYLHLHQIIEEFFSYIIDKFKKGDTGCFKMERST